MTLQLNHIKKDKDMTKDYLLELNPEQKKAVETTKGALLVLAGAGTGKTRVLTTRIVHLLKSGEAAPHQIMAVTFTNKAATEMKERVSSLLDGVPVASWWVGTFHSLSARMLRRHADRIGLNSNFIILDIDDQQRLLKQIAIDIGIDVKKWNPKLLASIIDGWKNKAKRPKDISFDDVLDIVDGKMLKIYEIYQARLKSLSACDFGDLLLHMIEILKDPKNKDILDLYHDQFRYMLVDEYQDTNVAQYLWLRLLAQKYKNICCVGDDDQSIYGWRGAEINNILRFEKDFLDAKIIRLEQNYRSTPQILQAANTLISHNNNRLGKELWSAEKMGEKIHLQNVWDSKQEAIEINAEIKKLKQVNLNNIAILVRAGFQTREFEERFMTTNLPYRVVGGLRFYERAEIRDAIAYFRLLIQPADDLAFERIINKPKRGIGKATIGNLHAFAKENNLSLYAASLELVKKQALRPKLLIKLKEFIDNFESWRMQMSEIPHSELAENILNESGYIDMWKSDKSIEAEGKIENLKELVGAIAEFENLHSFLEHIALVMETQKNINQDMVTIMTLHAAKGLEFDYVFLPGWEEGLFPNQKAIDEGGIKSLEEERRLAYVGLTRAKKKAYIFHASNRQIFGNWTDCIPSRFISELPEDLVEAKSDSGFYRGHKSCNLSHFDNSTDTNRAYISTNTVNTKEKTGNFQAGVRVKHSKFGTGTILTADGDKLEISFDTAGRKKIISRFVEIIS